MGNPYNYHLPVLDDAMFFGRAALLRRLYDSLTQPRPISAALFGGRRCGKTSLLRKLERGLQSGAAKEARDDSQRRTIPWYYDPQAGYPIGSSDDFFLLILEDLRQALCSQVPAKRVEDVYDNRLRLGPVHAFEVTFRTLAGQVDESIRMVLLIDEAEVLLTAPWGSDLRPNLRNLLSNSGIVDSLAMVMAGSTTFHTQVTEKDSPLENILTRHVLTNLTCEETLDLARQPNGGLLSARAAQEVWAQTGGHACLAQFILHELWPDIEQAMPEDVQDVAAGFSDSLDHFDRWSATLSPLAHGAYRWLLDRGDPVSYGQVRRAFSQADGSEVQRALELLTYHGLINVAGRGRRKQFNTAGQMFHDWYLSDRPSSTSTVRPPGGTDSSPSPHQVRAYDLFDVEIETREGGLYEIQVLHAPTGPVRSAPVPFNPKEPEFREMLKRVQAGDIDLALLTEIGQRLYGFLFPPPVLAACASSREAARGRGRGLGIKLRQHQPELASLPWELLYDPQGQSFLALSDRTPVIRFLPGVLESPLPPASPPWHLLLVTASPKDWPALDVERERRAVLDAVHPLVEGGQVVVTRLDGATPAGLLVALREGVHWLHFVGHGQYDPGSGQGAVVLEREDRSGTLMDVDTLRHLLPEVHERASARLRLVFLNACATAQVGVLPGTRGLAQVLAQAGVPNTIGMTRPISDWSARAFSEGFYSALAGEGWPLPAAVSEGRRRVMVESGLHNGDWAVPVLFMRGEG